MQVREIWEIPVTRSNFMTNMDLVLNGKLDVLWI